MLLKSSYSNMFPILGIPSIYDSIGYADWLLHRLITRCRDKSCDIIKWLTSSSAQYDRWLATLAQMDISKRPLGLRISHDETATESEPLQLLTLVR